MLAIWLGFLCHWIKKELILLVDPYYQRVTGLQLYNGGKEDYFWNLRDFLGHLLVLACPFIEVNQKLQQPNTGRVTEDSGSLGIKVSITPSDKEPHPAKVLTEHEGSTEWLVEEGAMHISYDLKTSFRKESYTRFAYFLLFILLNMFICIC